MVGYIFAVVFIGILFAGLAENYNFEKKHKTYLNEIKKKIHNDQNIIHYENGKWFK